MWYYVVAAVMGGILFLIVLTALICFFKVFYSPKRKPVKADEYPLPPDEIYKPHHEQMRTWIKQVRAMPHENVSVVSFDGLTLRGKYYEHKAGAPVELMFHGYHGTSERDLCGGVERCFALGRNALLIEQRGSGTSDGRVISFGINERKDCLKWIEFALARFGKDVQIILTGISMGGATVLMAAGEKLPENVVYVLADCPYSSAREIICKSIKEMKLPPKIVYPFVRLGARLFGGFSLEETSPLQAMKTCKTPVIFLHGDTDDFVPFTMSERLYEACQTKKKLVKITGAGHGLAYPCDIEGYLKAVREFDEAFTF